MSRSTDLMSEEDDIKYAETNVGQLIEYLEGRLYLASYLHPPNEDTLFPVIEQAPRSRRARGAVASTTTSAASKNPYYFTVDDALLYNAFHHDFGPLHVGHVYRFGRAFHDILSLPEVPQDRPIVLWSRPDPRSRANAACILACYMVLVQHWPPYLALAPIAQADPPFMPFRDAGYSQADYSITIQDVVYGVWKAKEESVLNIESFNLEEYEKYERVKNGDFNWITPQFLAFASPQLEPVERVTDPAQFALLPRTVEQIRRNEKIPSAFKKVLTHFKERNIGLVVRLNEELYSPSYFEALGIKHLDLFFEDGTCPSINVVRKFVRIAHDTITNRKQSIAVHCKAGLGRTGCLIGAYLIYRHGFTADEVIGFMRFMRPGMVVGPQQHWLHIYQGRFREWWIEEAVERRIREKIAARAASRAAASNSSGAGHIPSTPTRAMQVTSIKTSTPPQRSSNRMPLGEVGAERNNIVSAPQEDYLPAPTPGQPRKAARLPSFSPSPQQVAVARYDAEAAAAATAARTNGTSIDGEVCETEIMSVRHLSHGDGSDEEVHVRMRRHRKASGKFSQSPLTPDADKSTTTRHHHNGTTTMTTTTTSNKTTVYRVVDGDDDPLNDVENMGANGKSLPPAVRPSVKSSVSTPVGSSFPSSVKTRSTSGTVMVDKAAASIISNGKVRGAGVRKVSGRMGSHGGASAAAVNAVRRISGQQQQQQQQKTTA